MNNFYCETVDLFKLNDKAREIVEKEKTLSIEEEDNTCLRIKVTDDCGHACVFCHNEGTRTLSPIRTSIFLKEGEGFYTENIHAGEEFLSVIKKLGYKEIHLTGGEPTHLKDIRELVKALSSLGLIVKITSNGETGGKPYDDIEGLHTVNFSLHGTTPEEYLMTQNPCLSLSWAKQKLSLQNEAIKSAIKAGICVKANTVMCDERDKNRVLRLIDKANREGFSLRILDNLGSDDRSIVAIYNLLGELNVIPFSRKIVKNSSSCSVKYHLSNGQIICFKQIREFRDSKICEGCPLSDNGCREGYYGLRLYKVDGRYKIGYCIQRMDKVIDIKNYLLNKI